MKRETLYVTISNGAKVPFEEFERWSQHKQRMHTDHPIRKINWGLTHSKKMSEIVKAQYQAGIRINNWNYGKCNGQSIAVMTPAGQFETLKSAATYYRVDTSILKGWITNQPNKFYYVNPLSAEEIRKLRPGKRAVITPAGKFETIWWAASRSRSWKVSQSQKRTQNLPSEPNNHEHLELFGVDG